MPAQGSDVFQPLNHESAATRPEHGEPATQERQSTGFEELRRRMLTVTRGDLVEWGIAAALFAVPVYLAVWTSEEGNLLIIAAFAFGLIRRPRHIWGICIASILLVWLAATTWSLWGNPAENENQETIVSFFFLSILFTAFLVLLPLWIGRLIGNWLIRISGKFRA